MLNKYLNEKSPFVWRSALKVTSSARKLKSTVVNSEKEMKLTHMRRALHHSAHDARANITGFYHVAES